MGKLIIMKLTYLFILFSSIICNSQTIKGVVKNKGFYVMASAHKCLSQMRADEAICAGNQNFLSHFLAQLKIQPTANLAVYPSPLIALVA